MAVHTEVATQERYRSGVVEMIVLPNDADYPIQEGDLTFEDSGTVYPASTQADQGTPAANKVEFARLFAGVALSKDGLQTGEHSFLLTTRKGVNLVGTTGVYEFPCDATEWVTGQLVGATEIAAGTSLEDQKVERVTLEAEAIGLAKVPLNAIGTSMTTILVVLRSQLMRQDIGSGQ